MGIAILMKRTFKKYSTKHEGLEMKFEKMKLSELRPAEYNPRVKLKPGREEYEKLKQSILEFSDYIKWLD